MTSWTRRTFLQATGMTGAALVCPTASSETAAMPGKAPFRVLFGNDTTNIESCPSPFKTRGTPFGEAHLRASIAETAGHGIDAHLLQPGLGWVPWWKSRVLPMERHVDWLKSRGQKPNPFELFVLNGGDMVRTLIDACRACGEAPFVSLRMNDAHHIYRGGRARPDVREQALSEFQFFADHPEYRIGPDAEGDERMRYMLDWGQLAVRDYKLRLIDELCDAYDFVGLELDFMRHWIFFNLKRTTPDQRRTIQIDFVQRVRRALDRTAPSGKRRWLCVRIPAHPATFDAMGIDPAAFAAAGVDMVNASSHYFTDCQLELAALRTQLPSRVALYAEVQYVSATTQKIADPAHGQTLVVNRRTTREQFNTVAHQAYAQGADGVSAFNFQYYRGTYNPTDVYGAPAEPPYEVFDRLADRAWLARQPQHYFIGLGQGQPKKTGRPFQDPVPVGGTVHETLSLAPPAGGWQGQGRLRIQALDTLGTGRWTAALNGQPLEPIPDVSEPYANPYAVGLGAPENYRAWAVPAALLRTGDNAIALTLSEGKTVRIGFLDLAIGVHG